MIDTARLKESTDLRDIAGRYSALHRESAREMSGACPRCGGTDRLHVAADWWFCRTCHPKRGDALDFLEWLYGCDFRTAAAMLSGAVVVDRPALPMPAPHRAVQPDSWAVKAANVVQRAQDHLWGNAGGLFQEYLLDRGLEPHTWLTFGLGAASAWDGAHNAPAVMMPWTVQGRIVAIRYRFINHDAGRKTTSEPGSQFAGVLFGGHALMKAGKLRSLRTLVLCEGELNCCSIWQAASESNLDALSLGSETQTITPDMLKHLAVWGRVLVWMDKPELAEAAIARLPGASALHSPGGKDANDLLGAGNLGGFLAAARLAACADANEQEGLLWDLRDAASTMGGVDGGTAVMIAHIAGLVGKAAPIIEAEPGRWITED